MAATLSQIIFLCAISTTVVDATCVAPPPSSNFTLPKYSGLWYEIGKFQTAGGAAFEKDCVCTTIDIKPAVGATNSDASAYNSCRKLTPAGNFLNATGSLTEETVPGHWKEGFFPLVPKVDYTVVYLDDNLAIEYGCSTFFFITNYCIHLLAKTPSISAQDEQKLINFANSLGLNNQNLNYQRTMQINCW